MCHFSCRISGVIPSTAGDIRGEFAGAESAQRLIRLLLPFTDKDGPQTVPAVGAEGPVWPGEDVAESTFRKAEWARATTIKPRSHLRQADGRATVL